MSCTSIGLAVRGVPVLGVIYNPFLDMLVGPTHVTADHSTLAPRAAVHS